MTDQQHNDTQLFEYNTRDCMPEDALLESELYIFSRPIPERQRVEILWGVIDCVDDGVVRLESCSKDFSNFQFWTELPEGFHPCRRATMVEALDYGWRCGYFEAQDDIR